MNCTNHPEVAAAAFCRACGKALCPACQRTSQGTVFCAEHAPVEAPANPSGPAANASPYTVPQTAPPPPAWQPHANVSPGLAFILGLIPGVGAIYNGQYAKGLIHIMVFGGIISIMNAGAGGSEPLLGMMLFGWYAYMAFEAYHTAKRRQFGQPVDEFSSVFPLRGKAGRLPVGPLVLIGIGILFLLNNFNLIHFYDIAKFWPLFLIALGAYMLYSRLTNPLPSGPEEAIHEQR